MPILKFLENLAKGAVQLPVQFSENFSNTAANIGNRLGGKPDQTIQQNMGGDKLLNSTLNFSGATGKNIQLGSDAAQVALAAATPEIGEGVSSLFPTEAGKGLEATLGLAGGAGDEGVTNLITNAALRNPLDVSQASGLLAKTASGALTGASVGGAFNALGTAGQGKTGAKDLTLSFLEGTGTGAAFGGATGLIGGVAGLIGGVAKNLFGNDKLQKMATSENTSQIEKDIKPVTGPVVAQKIAPAISQAGDPEIVSNIIDNAVKEHISSPSLQEPALGTPPLDSTPVNPQQSVGQGSPEAASYANVFGVSQDQANKDLANPNSTELKSTTPEKPTGLQALQQSLATGESVTEAANRYMDETGASFDQTKKTIGDIMNSKDFPKGQVNSQLNPHYQEAQSIIPKATNQEQIIGNTKAIHGIVNRGADNAIKLMNQMPKEDLPLVFKLAGNNVDDIAKDALKPELFKQVAEAIKDNNDWKQALGSGLLGERTAYRSDYGLPIVAAPKEGEEILTGPEIGRAGKKINPNYSLPRNVTSYDQLEQAGYQPLFTDPRDLVAFDSQRRNGNFTDLALRKGFEEVYPGQVVSNKIGAAQGQNYAQIDFHGKPMSFSAPVGAAQEFNPRQEAINPNTFLKGYDFLNSQLKNAKLAGGGFHSANVLGSYGGQQIGAVLQGEASPVRGLHDLSTAIKSTFSQDAFDGKMSELEQKGRLIDFDAINMTTKTPETEGDVGAQGVGKLPVLKQIHEAIFGRQIPMLKMLIADQKLDAMGFDRNNPESLAEGMKIGKGLNQGFGGLNRDIQGLTPQNFKRASRIFLSTDYNEGQLRTLADAFSKGGPEGKLARQIVFGKAVLFGGIAAGLGAAGGEFQGKTPTQVALDILHKVANPEAQIGGYKVALPTTQVSEVEKPIEQTVSGIQAGKGIYQGAENFATNRLAAAPSEALQLGNNKNYLGQPIRGTDSRGRPISLGNTIANVASGTLPIPAAQAAQTATGNQSPLAALANTAGLRVTPTNTTSNLPVEQQTYISTLQKALQSSNIPKPQQKQATDAITNFDSIIKQNYAARQKVDAQINRDIAKGDMAKAKADANAFNQKLYQSISKAITPATQQYLNIQIPNSSLKTPYQYLTGNFYGYFTNLNLNSRKTTINNNPTKYGLKIGEKV